MHLPCYYSNNRGAVCYDKSVRFYIFAKYTLKGRKEAK